MMPRRELLDLKRGWMPPPGLDHSRPRDVAFTAGGRAIIALSAAFVIAGLTAGIWLFVLATRQQDERLRLRERGVDTQAVITRLWTTRNEEQRRYWASFRFGAGDRVVGGQQRVSRATWNNLREGSSISVRYDAPNPEVHAAFGRDLQALDVSVSYLGGLVLAFCGGLILLPLMSERRLLVEGRPTPGLVVNRQSRRVKHGGSHDQIEYEFLLLNGAARAGKCTGRKLAQGQAICVLYDPDHPARSAPYPLPLVRPARR